MAQEIITEVKETFTKDITNQEVTTRDKAREETTISRDKGNMDNNSRESKGNIRALSTSKCNKWHKIRR